MIVKKILYSINGTDDAPDGPLVDSRVNYCKYDYPILLYGKGLQAIFDLFGRRCENWVLGGLPPRDGL